MKRKPTIQKPRAKPRANDLAPAEVRDLEGCLKILDRYSDYVVARVRQAGDDTNPTSKVMLALEALIGGA